MRPDVLELIAEETGGRPVSVYARLPSLMDEGKSRLDGMAKGRRWDLEREQRQWEKANAADLARFRARRNWQRFDDANPERMKTWRKKWTASNWSHLLAYRNRWAKKNAAREREYDRRQMANTRADPVRLARYQARMDRHKAKKNARAKERYWSDVETSHALNRKYYARRPRVGKRKCGLCRQAGHNRRRCKRAEAH